MKETIKRHLISAGVTFVGTFIVAFCALISVDSFVFSVATLQAAAVSAIIVAARAAVKVVWEIGTYLLSKKGK